MSVAALLLPLACGSAAPGGAEGPRGADSATLVLPDRLPPVLAGSYRLSMSVRCESNERTARGTLTLERISAEDAATSGTERAGSRGGEGALLWGQTDLDFEELRPCLAVSTPSSEDPIHPGVLVEVLHWDGVPRHQVLLVSTDPRGAGTVGGSSGGGVAMWVESVDRGHITGVWSRWELMGEGEGHWEADLVRGDAVP